MRIIAGKWRSRQIGAPRGMATRPTSDRLRETLFNVLGQNCSGFHVVDLYAGTGAVGLEALSRGAAKVWFAEKAAPAVAALRANLRALGAGTEAVVETGGAAALLSRLVKEQAVLDLVFLDPPWDAAEEYEKTLRTLGDVRTGPLFAENTRVIAEHRNKTEMPETIGRLQRYRVLKQGDAALSFYRFTAV